MIIDTHQHFYEPGTPRAKGPEDYKMLAVPEAVTGAGAHLIAGESLQRPRRVLPEGRYPPPADVGARGRRAEEGV